MTAIDAKAGAKRSGKNDKSGNVKIRTCNSYCRAIDFAGKTVLHCLPAAAAQQ